MSVKLLNNNGGSVELVADPSITTDEIVRIGSGGTGGGGVAGVIFDFAGATPPEGSLICDGRALLKSEYTELYAAIGDLWNDIFGDPPPSEYFRIPPQEFEGIGLFTRGVGAGAGNKDDSSPQDAAPTQVGQYQSDVFKEHTHSARSGYNSKLAIGSQCCVASGSVSGATGDPVETRPRVMVVNKCIWTGGTL